jgi:hypothetical protein
VAKRSRAHRERAAAELQRKKGKRPGHDRVLIVTEGTKTEPNYLNEIRREGRISGAHVRVLPAEGTQPLKVVASAEAFFTNSKEYERIYAVFDRDSHEIGNYRNALNKATALDRKMKNSEGARVAFKAIPSVPCFEFWLLLHFEDIQAFHERDVIYRRLRGHLPAYSKGQEGTFAATVGGLEVAIGRAVNLRRHYTANHGAQPFTEMDVLVVLLRSLGTTR